METITLIMNALPSVVAGILTIIGGAAAIAAVTPTPKDDNFIAKIQGYVKRVADLIGLKPRA